LRFKIIAGELLVRLLQVRIKAQSRDHAGVGDAIHSPGRFSEQPEDFQNDDDNHYGSDDIDN